MEENPIDKLEEYIRELELTKEKCSDLQRYKEAILTRKKIQATQAKLNKLKHEELKTNHKGELENLEATRKKQIADLTAKYKTEQEELKVKYAKVEEKIKEKKTKDNTAITQYVEARTPKETRYSRKYYELKKGEELLRKQEDYEQAKVLNDQLLKIIEADIKNYKKNREVDNKKRVDLMNKKYTLEEKSNAEKLDLQLKILKEKYLKNVDLINKKFQNQKREMIINQKNEEYVSADVNKSMQVVFTNRVRPNTNMTSHNNSYRRTRTLYSPKSKILRSPKSLISPKSLKSIHSQKSLKSNHSAKSKKSTLSKKSIKPNDAKGIDLQPYTTLETEELVQHLLKMNF